MIYFGIFLDSYRIMFRDISRDHVPAPSIDDSWEIHAIPFRDPSLPQRPVPQAKKTFRPQLPAPQFILISRLFWKSNVMASQILCVASCWALPSHGLAVAAASQAMPKMACVAFVWHLDGI